VVTLATSAQLFQISDWQLFENTQANLPDSGKTLSQSQQESALG
jgi:hypothetical protein